MNRLSERKKAELRLIAQLTVEATLGAEEKIARLAERTKTGSASGRRYARSRFTVLR